MAQITTRNMTYETEKTTNSTNDLSENSECIIKLTINNHRLINKGGNYVNQN